MAAFEIKLKYVYEVREELSNNRWRIDNGWEGFCSQVRHLPQLRKNGYNVPCVLHLTRYLNIRHAQDMNTGKIIQPCDEILNVPLKNWVNLAGFKKYDGELRYVHDNAFKYGIVVASDGKIPTIADLEKACPWKCERCEYKSCRNADKNTPAYYSGYVRVGVVPLNPECYMCISKDDCKHLWPQPYNMTPAGVSQELRDFFDQPDSIQIYTNQGDRLLNIHIYSCALREK